MSTRAGTAPAVPPDHVGPLHRDGHLWRHEPEYTALYRTIEAHLETFLAQTAEGVALGDPGALVCGNYAGCPTFDRVGFL